MKTIAPFLKKIFHNLICCHQGVDWLGRGWGEGVEKDGVKYLELFYACNRCGIRASYFESTESCGKRFSGYHSKYGYNNILIKDHNFEAPRPNAYVPYRKVKT